MVRIAGSISWDSPEYHGPNCKVDNPAFTPEYLTKYGFENEPPYPLEENGVTIYSWHCVMGIHGSDDHFVTGYFVHSL